MRLHRFFIEQKIGNTKGKEITITDSNLIHQWRNVFRYTVGSFVILLDNSGLEVMGQIEKVSTREVQVHILEERENKGYSPFDSTSLMRHAKSEFFATPLARRNKNMPKKELYVFQSMIKKSTFEWEIEKLTELGVTHIIPILSERSEKKNVNIERCRKILKEASEQCGRGTIPVLHNPCNLEDTVTEPVSQKIAFHIDGTLFKKEVYEKEKSLGVYIGPEGGWGERDVSFFEKNSIPLVSLGSQTLRAETAGLAISSLLLL